MRTYITIGLTALAGAAFIEAALLPGLAIGAVAVLAPTILPRMRARGRGEAAFRTGRQSSALAVAPNALPATLPQARKLGIKQAILKTITFRIVVTSLDFTANYFVIGELTTAAGLSAFSLVAGPVFYLVHETVWNYYGPAEGPIAVRLSPLGRNSGAATPNAPRVFVLNRAIAKTITFRTVATVMDFTANYVVVGDILTAAGLSAFGFVLGPFVYLGHEMVWDRFASPARPPLALPPPAAGAAQAV